MCEVEFNRSWLLPLISAYIKDKPSGQVYLPHLSQPYSQVCRRPTQPALLAEINPAQADDGRQGNACPI